LDKYEYKVRADEIKDLIARGEYIQAVEIADTIDWRRVKSVMMLCTISDLYKINRRYEDAKNMLLLAYERRPGGRTICYSLCELCIKTEDFVQAINYYKEYAQAAPKDPGRYILQYKLYEAQDVSLEERIGVLEELKKRDYREKWAYELAYLYHRIGLATRCVEECDELILWFGEGKYVIKAMELKMLHQPLSPEQQERYDHRFDTYSQPAQMQEQEVSYTAPGQTVEALETSETKIYQPVSQRRQESGYIQESGYGQSSEYMQESGYGQSSGYMQESGYGQSSEYVQESEYVQGAEYAQESGYGQSSEYVQESGYVQGAEYAQGAGYGESSKYAQESGYGQSPEYAQESGYVQGAEYAQGAGYGESSEFAQESGHDREPVYGRGAGYVSASMSDENSGFAQESVYEREPVYRSEPVSELEQETAGEQGAEPPQELDIHVKTMDMGRYNTINLQAEIAEGMREVLEEDKAARDEAITRSIMAPLLDSETESLDMPEIDEVDENDLESEQETIEDSEVFFGETGEIGDIRPSEREPVVPDLVQPGAVREPVVPDLVQPGAVREPVAQDLVQQEAELEPVAPESVRQGTADSAKRTAKKPEQAAVFDATAELVMAQMKEESIGKKEEQVLTAQPPKELAGVLAQESDGQISLVVPESQHVEKQITGQLDINDILTEWERMKEENAQKRQEEVRQRVLQQTGEMFNAFEASVRDGLLEQLEGESAEQEEESDDRLPSERMREAAAAREKSAGDHAEPAPENYAESEESWESGADEEELFADSDSEEYIGDGGSAEPVLNDYAGTEESVQPGADEEEQFAGSGPEDIAESGTIVGKSAASEDDAQDWDSTYQESADMEDADGVSAGTEEEESAEASVEREQGKVRSLTREERELYAPFIQSRSSREQLVQAIDAISMAAYTGNIIITGEEGMDTITLAKNMIREVQMTDSNFAGKVAKISGQALNKKNLEETLGQLKSGALIIQKASGMSGNTVQQLYKALQQEALGIIIVLEDTKKAINRLLEDYPDFAGCFTARMDVEALSNDTLVAFGRQYAREQEYSVDELGVLALHRRIEELQTIDHVVTVLEVKEIMDDAIRHANKKNLKHFIDILFARRYDEEDMIVLTEMDFV